MAKPIDIYQKVTDQIIQQIEAGAGEFNMPWHQGTFIPSNVFRRTQYRGVNILYLWSQTKRQGYGSHLWGTRNQWNKLGAKVRRGERATEVVYCNFGEDVDEHHVRMWPVFNVAQVRGYEVPATPSLAEAERIEKAETFFSKLGALVRFGGHSAYYNQSTDHIQMPAFELFFDSISYYSTFGHEHIHWTGAKHRLKRFKDASVFFGSEEYAFEELIAEIGAAFLCAKLRITNKPRQDHAQYIASWLKALRNDKTAIFKAASKAQKAADWLQKRQSVRKKPVATQAPKFSAAKWLQELEHRKVG